MISFNFKFFYFYTLKIRILDLLKFQKFIKSILISTKNNSTTYFKTLDVGWELLIT